MRARLPGYPRRILIDTSAYFALTNRRDVSHPFALAVRDQLVAERWHLFTTNFLLAFWRRPTLCSWRDWGAG